LDLLTIDRVTDAMKGVMSATGISTFDAVIPNEIGGMNAFEALLAAHRFNKSTLDTDLVARAYPKVWQTVRCLNDVPITPAAVTGGAGKQQVINISSIIPISSDQKLQVFQTAHDNLETEDLMRDACTEFGSLSGMCISPVQGTEAKTLPHNSFSHGTLLSLSSPNSIKLILGLQHGL
jgi:DUF917 family protein